MLGGEGVGGVNQAEFDTICATLGAFRFGVVVGLQQRGHHGCPHPGKTVDSEHADFDSSPLASRLFWCSIQGTKVGGLQGAPSSYHGLNICFYRLQSKPEDLRDGWVEHLQTWVNAVQIRRHSTACTRLLKG
uniref:Uncharacterized protein n=1 Tax=Eutreptiella gymnastica TaxID=73025 RepID=A0A7S1IBY1_9EUGL